MLLSTQALQGAALGSQFNRFTTVNWVSVSVKPENRLFLGGEKVLYRESFPKYPEQQSGLHLKLCAS